MMVDISEWDLTGMRDRSRAARLMAPPIGNDLITTVASEARRAGEALIREADDLACQSWNERMWADGGPIDPSGAISATGRPASTRCGSAASGRRRRNRIR
jgi:hypothetical protein